MEHVYNENHCWQYNIRLNNLSSDLEESNLTQEQVESLPVSDFSFQYEPKELIWKEAKAFIEKHEWLGKMGLYPTHIFTARYKDILAGVVSMDMPNSFSKLLGEDTKYLERLIGRGACISWSPKNLGSKLISFAMKWMVKNTKYRLFTAYSDTEARELGTIYQACNFYYLGKKSGAAFKYKLENGNYVSDRHFRSRSVYKKLAKNNNILWNKEWQDGDKVIFSKMPSNIALTLKELSKQYQLSCPKVKIEAKHKYAFVLADNKMETKRLRKEFEERNIVYPYPKDRGN